MSSIHRHISINIRSSSSVIFHYALNASRAHSPCIRMLFLIHFLCLLHWVGACTWLKWMRVCVCHARFRFDMISLAVMQNAKRVKTHMHTLIGSAIIHFHLCGFCSNFTLAHSYVYFFSRIAYIFPLFKSLPLNFLSLCLIFSHLFKHVRFSVSVSFNISRFTSQYGILCF